MAQGANDSQVSPGGGEISLKDLYGMHVEEYRFQVDLNWRRTQYFIALNSAIFAVGVTQASSSISAGGRLPAAAVLLVGAAFAVLCIAATMRQHEYYRNIREGLRAIGDELDLGDRGLRTTRGMRARDADVAPSDTLAGLRRFGSRVGRVTTMTYVILALFASVEFLGMLYVLTADTGRVAADGTQEASETP